MIRSAIAICLLLSCFVSATRSAAEPVVTETIVYYDVAGTTPQEVRRELNRLGPFNNRGRRFDAYTNWYVRWRYAYRPAAAECSVASVTLTVDVSTQFPRLKESASTPPALKRAFDDFAEKLLGHERGHIQNARDIAKRIEDGILALPAQSDCTVLERAANDFGQSLLKEGNQWDIDYDESTRHGATQGVHFP